jgi:tetratricopeptide (TPR) repeat protein
MPLAHLFLSHSSADDGFVRELRQALADLGQEVWIDSRQLKGGDPLWSAIQAAIEAAAGLVVLVSPDAFQTDWVARELKHGLKVQAERGLAAFPVILLVLDGTKPGSLAGYFDENPIFIPVSSAPGGATAALHDILVALGLRLPTDRPKAAVQPRPEAVEELVLKLSNLRFFEEDGKPRAAGTAQLIYEPATTGQRAVESGKWRLIAPLGPIQAKDLSWYLERWAVWPNPVVAKRAKKVETNLKDWGEALYAAALPPVHTATVLQAWAGVSESASRRFSVSVDPSLEAGSSEAETATAQEAATALLALPWELLRNGDGFLFQGARPTRVRRRLPNTRNLPVPVVAPPIRVLLITARPEDDACVYIDHRESASPLVAATEELGEAMKLTLLHPATYPALETELARAKQAGELYHVVHFDGHGIYDSLVHLGGLCFEDPRDSGKLTGRRHEKVFTDRLGPLLTNYRIPLVFLEACQSAQAEAGGESVATELLQRGVASVVAMSHSVLVETSRRFVKAFYGELAKGQRVGQAMLAGQRALHSDPNRGERYGIGELTLADWFVPVLYQEENDPQLFTAIPAPQTTEDQKARLRARLGEVPPAPVDTGFVGRSRDLLALERLLRKERWAVVRGQGGEGKTALAAELARWLVRSQQVKRAAFVSVELCSHQDAVLDALGRQLVGDEYSAAKFEGLEQALLPIERALKEQDTLLVIDNMESVLLPPYLEAPELLSEEAAEELKAILSLAQRLLRVGDTRIVFTSREALPAPFAAERQRRELGRLERSDAVALIERSLAAGDSDTRGATRAAGALEAQREEIEALVDAVQGHARTLALLGPQLRRRGVATTQVELVDLMEQMQRQVADLPAEDPRRREQSLFASVELSLRRLSAANRERVRLLGVFHGGVHLGVLQAMTGWDQGDVEGLAVELEATGLATANPYNHLSLNPALCPLLQARFSAREREALSTRWLEVMAAYLHLLVQQQSQNTELAASLTLLDLPNLFALLDDSQAAADPETTIDRATSLYSLLRFIGQPRLLERVARVRDGTAAALGEGWSHARFQASYNRIDHQLAGRQLRQALAGAQQLLQQAQTAGERAYVGADYDFAMALHLLGEVLQIAGGAQRAVPLLQEAGRRFEVIALQRPSVGAENMASRCITAQGTCLLDLGQFDDAAAAYEEAIRRDELRGDMRGVAAGKGQLGSVRLEQGLYSDALEAHKEAREIFERLNESSSVSIACLRIGEVQLKAGEPEAAEEAINRSLQIGLRINNLDMQAKALNNLGVVYDHYWKRHEEAAGFYRRAAEISRNLGDPGSEGGYLHNLADTLRKLECLEDAKSAIKKAIDRIEPFGHTFQPWKSFSYLADIETQACNPSAAAAARQRARAAYLAYRRDGGESQFKSGRLVLAIGQSLTAGPPAEAASLLQQLAADPDLAEALPLLTALQAITAGNRDRSLAEDPGLHYSEAAEVLLLIEALEGGGGG